MQISKFQPVSGFRLVFIWPLGNNVSFKEIGEKPWLILAKKLLFSDSICDNPNFGDTIGLNVKLPDWSGLFAETSKRSSNSYQV